MTTLALIGFGKWGKNYLKTIENINDCKIKYICSTNIQKNYFEKKDYVLVNNYKTLLSKKDLDGVIIATPNKTHYKISRDFLQKGINVLVEKPIALTTNEVTSLHKLSKKNNCLILTDYIYLYNPAFQIIKKNLPMLGKIFSFEFEMGNVNSLKDDSSLLSWGPHFLSILFTLADKYLKDMKFKLEQDKNKNIKINIKLGDNKRVLAKLGNNFKIKKRKFKIIGEKGNLYFNELSKEIVKIIFKNGKETTPKYKKISGLENVIMYFIKNLNKGIKNKDIKTDLFVTNFLEKF